LVPGGTTFVQHPSTDPAQVWQAIPADAQAFIRHNQIRVMVLDAVKVAREVSSHPQLAQRMQGIVLLGVFLRVAPFVAKRELSDEQVYAAVEGSLRKFFGKRGEQVIRENLQAVQRGRDGVFEIPREIIVTAA
jgi:pyruvate-ferredoxin/flavodoxin oxidoreductase